ncbi:MAG: type II toxin-antitoxin system HicA family toxin [Dehalococcoidia bacterium]
MAERLPVLRPPRIIAALVRCGLVIDHQTGSHVVLYKDGLRRPMSVPNHSRDLPPGFLRKILRQPTWAKTNSSRTCRPTCNGGVCNTGDGGLRIAVRPHRQVRAISELL